MDYQITKKYNRGGALSLLLSLEIGPHFRIEINGFIVERHSNNLSKNLLAEARLVWLENDSNNYYTIDKPIPGQHYYFNCAHDVLTWIDYKATEE